MKPYQFELELDTVQELNRYEDHYEFWNPSIFVDGGSIDVYTSEELPADKSEMVLEESDHSMNTKGTQD